MKIGNVEIDNPVFVAPMAGVSNVAFRSICREFGAGLIGAEMVSDKALYYDNERTIDMIKVYDDERPISLQIFGADVDSMVYAAKMLDEKSACDIIDINMGCPVNKVIKANSGSALLKDEERAVAIVKAVVENVKKPVTVKMRIGFDDEHINVVSLAKKFEEVGASAICVHGRTREQMYSGKANWDIIRQVKEALNIPVIGNGDITSVDDMIEMFEVTGCDAIAIARASLGNPFLIRECVHYLKTKERLPKPTYNEILDVMLDHARRLVKLKGEDTGIKEMRGHATHYVKGLKGSKRVKREYSLVNTYEELVNITNQYRDYLAKLEDIYE